MNTKEPYKPQPNQFVSNYDMGKMLYNRAVDKLTESKNISQSDKNDCLDLFRQSIPYFNNAIKSFDTLDVDCQVANRTNLNYCLNALNTIYIRLDMYDELKPIKIRIEELR